MLLVINYVMYSTSLVTTPVNITAVADKKSNIFGYKNYTSYNLERAFLKICVPKCLQKNLNKLKWKFLGFGQIYALKLFLFNFFVGAFVTQICSQFLSQHKIHEIFKNQHDLFQEGKFPLSKGPFFNLQTQKSVCWERWLRWGLLDTSTL